MKNIKRIGMKALIAVFTAASVVNMATPAFAKEMDTLKENTPLTVEVTSVEMGSNVKSETLENQSVDTTLDVAASVSAVQNLDILPVSEVEVPKVDGEVTDESIQYVQKENTLEPEVAAPEIHEEVNKDVPCLEPEDLPAEESDKINPSEVGNPPFSLDTAVNPAILNDKLNVEIPGMDNFAFEVNPIVEEAHQQEISGLPKPVLGPQKLEPEVDNKKKNHNPFDIDEEDKSDFTKIMEKIQRYTDINTIPNGAIIDEIENSDLGNDEKIYLKQLVTTGSNVIVNPLIPGYGTLKKGEAAVTEFSKVADAKNVPAKLYHIAKGALNFVEGGISLVPGGGYVAAATDTVLNTIEYGIKKIWSWFS